MAQPRKHPPSGPARYLRHYQQFGHADPGVFRPAPKGEEHLHEAAAIQHRFARTVRHQISRLDLGDSEVAAQAGISTEHLQRLLRGDAPMALPLMLRIAATVAIDVTVDFRPIE